jgi:hypothetical protein
MAKFPRDAPRKRVVKTLERLGFRLVSEHEHVSMLRTNADDTETPLKMPNHRRIKADGPTLPARRGGLSGGAMARAAFSTIAASVLSINVPHVSHP